MKKEEIIEGNKLIAEFMGYPYIEQDCYITKGIIGEEQVEYIEIGTVISKEPIRYYVSGTHKCLRVGQEIITLNCDIDKWYNSSWSWLMAVVDKIESIHQIIEGKYLNIIISQGYIEINGLSERIFRNTSIEGSKKNALWLALIDFLKLYNNLKK